MVFQPNNIARRDDGADRDPVPSTPNPGSFSIEFIEPRYYFMLDVGGAKGTSIEVFDETGELASITLPRDGRQTVLVPLGRPPGNSLQVRVASGGSNFRVFGSAG